MSEPFDVRSYSIDAFCAVLAESAPTDLEIIAAKTHRVYFDHYFQAQFLLSPRRFAPSIEFQQYWPSVRFIQPKPK